jgi:hypothetical protein
MASLFFASPIFADAIGSSPFIAAIAASLF